MIIVSGVFEIDAADRERALEAGRVMARASRAESGCRAYAFYADIEEPARVRVFEEWDDLAALEEHFRTPHMATFRQTLGELRILSRNVHRYEVQQATQL